MSLDFPRNPKYSMGPLPNGVFVSTTQCDGSNRVTFEIKKIVKWFFWNRWSFKPVYVYYYHSTFWNIRTYSSEMVKNPLNRVEENIEICCSERIKNSVKNFQVSLLAQLMIPFSTVTHLSFQSLENLGKFGSTAYWSTFANSNF